MTSPEMQKPKRQLTLSYSTSTVASFSDCKTILLVYHLVPNIQNGGRKPEVVIT